MEEHIKYTRKRGQPKGKKGECSKCHKQVGVYSNGTIYRHGVTIALGGLCSGSYRKPVGV